VRAMVKATKGKKVQYYYDVGPEQAEKLKYENDDVVVLEWGRYRDPESEERKLMEEVIR